MEELLTALIEWLFQIPPWSIVAILIVIAYLENIIPPIPGDVLIVAGGYLMAEGQIRISPLYIGATLSSTLGFMTLYYLGRTWGSQIRESEKAFWIRKILPLKYLEKAQRYMKRYGLTVVLVNRFLAGTRSIISLSAGMTHYPAWRTLWASLISSAVWNAVLIGAGWVLSSSWREFGGILKIYGQVVLGILMLLVLSVWLYRHWKKKQELKEKY